MAEPTSAAMRAAERICERLGYGAHHVDAYEWAARIADAEFAPLLQAADVALADAAASLNAAFKAVMDCGRQMTEAEFGALSNACDRADAALAAYRERRGAQ